MLTRLNQQEYNNTVRDLLGVAGNPAADFPSDDFGDSFNNNGRALTVSPVLTEAYLSAAEELSRIAIQQEGLLECETSTVGVENCATRFFAQFLGKAFRRPVLDSEIEPYVSLVLEAREQGGSFEDGIAAGIEAALLSVNFLFKVEVDPEANSKADHRLTDYELATRLSYYLWSTMPDAALTKAAQDGELGTLDGLNAQLDRMLEDPRSSALLDSFAHQWLETGDIGRSNAPDTELFPGYTPELKQAMQTETSLYLQDVLTGQLPYDQVLTSGYTYVNQALAQHYGLEGDFGEDFAKVDLAGSSREGLLTHGSVLTLTSAANRTSITRRGVWVLSNLLCSTPPPPPPGVQSDLDAPPSEDGEPVLTLAERTQLHSDDPACAGCHNIMDPIGFALEDFDGIGRYRGTADAPIEPPPQDAGAELPTEADSDGGTMTDGGVPPSDSPSEPNGEQASSAGKVYATTAELNADLAEDQRLPACAARKLLTYALARIPSNSEEDRCRITRLEDVFSSENYDFRALLRAVVLTDSFRGRHGGLETSETLLAPTEENAQ